MNGLKVKDLKINGLRSIKINGLKYLRISELKRLMHRPKDRDNTEIEGLMKSKEEIETEIRKLFREKKDIESRIGQFQNIEERENEEISEFPWREEIFPPLRRKMYPEMSEFVESETDTLQKEDTEILERTDSWIEKKVEKTDESVEAKRIKEIESLNTKEIKVEEETKSANGKSEVENSEKANFINIRKKDEETVFSENVYKIKTAGSILEENKKENDRMPEKSKTENEKPVQGIFGSSLIEDLLESEDLYPDEEQSFMKYIEESSATELIADLREVRKLLT